MFPMPVCGFTVQLDVVLTLEQDIAFSLKSETD